MDSSKHGMSKSEFVDDGQMSNSTGRGENQDIKDNFYKVKNVFEILIGEAAYLIDEKALQQCEGKSKKEQFLIMIDSIRKSLGIESMDDVQLLVDTFYEFGPKKRERLAAEEEARRAAKEEQQSNPGAPPTTNQKEEKKKGGDKGKDKDGNKNQQPEVPTIEDEEQEEKDPLQPDIDLDDVVEVLEEFHKKREEKLNNQELIGNPSLKKKSNFQTEVITSHKNEYQMSSLITCVGGTCRSWFTPACRYWFRSVFSSSFCWLSSPVSSMRFCRSTRRA